MDSETAEGHITAVVAVWAGVSVQYEGMEKGQVGLGCMFAHLPVLGRLSQCIFALLFSHE